MRWLVIGLALMTASCATTKAAVTDSTGVLGGLVRDSVTSTPIHGATVIVYGPSRNGANTDSLGRFEISGLRGGTYDVRAQYLSCAMRTQTARIRAGRRDTLVFRLPCRLPHRDPEIDSR